LPSQNDLWTGRIYFSTYDSIRMGSCRENHTRCRSDNQ
jgi:hypothetical protein